MKYILVVVLCMAIGVVNSLIDPSEFDPKLKELIKTLRDTCTERSKIGPETYKEFWEFKYPDKDEAKKYVACLWFESSTLDKNLKVNEEIYLDIAPEKVKGYIVGVTKGCFAKEPVDKELYDKIYSATKCIFDYNRENVVQV